MNNPLAGTDPSGYSFLPSNRSTTTIWDKKWGDTITIDVEDNNGNITTIDISRKDYEEGKLGKLGDTKLNNVKDITIIDSKNGTLNVVYTGGTDNRNQKINGVTLADIEKDPTAWLNSLDPITKEDGGFTSNKDLNAAVKKEKKKKTTVGSVDSSFGQRVFAINAHRVIGEALSQFNNARYDEGKWELELAMEIRQSADGQMIIINAFLAELGASVDMTPGTSFIMHWHHQTNDRSPGSGDYLMTKNHGMTNFVAVMSDQLIYRAIYEVGRPAGNHQQRQINMTTGRPGEWENSPEHHQEWNPTRK
jgi:hypothetical protein